MTAWVNVVQAVCPYMTSLGASVLIWIHVENMLDNQIKLPSTLDATIHRKQKPSKI